MRASKIMQKKAFENPKIEILFNTTIDSYVGDDMLRGLVLRDTVTGAKREVQAGGLFMAIGHDPMTSVLKNTGLELTEQGYIKVHNHVHTNIEGVFAAGDVHDTHYRQVLTFSLIFGGHQIHFLTSLNFFLSLSQAVTAAGFGCMAAITAERWLDNKKVSQPLLHSKN